MNTPSSFEVAKTSLDHAHAADPEMKSGRPAELVYADSIETWISQLIPQPSVVLQLAARAQHLERWIIPRSQFPMDRPSYHAWRRAVQARQGTRARELLSAAGCDAAICERVATLVAKAALKSDLESQALEDAACLVFLEQELAAFASAHQDYPREKFIDILRKTWRKMSPQAHSLALTIPIPDALKTLVAEAVSG